MTVMAVISLHIHLNPHRILIHKKQFTKSDFSFTAFRSCIDNMTSYPSVSQILCLASLSPISSTPAADSQKSRSSTSTGSRGHCDGQLSLPTFQEYWLVFSLLLLWYWLFCWRVTTAIQHQVLRILHLEMSAILAETCCWYVLFYIMVYILLRTN